jgi:hypothetical protein
VAGRHATGGHFGKAVIFVNVTEFVRGSVPGLTKVNGGSSFFREHHYLNPLMVDDSDQPML